jgi:hypothetical protein
VRITIAYDKGCLRRWHVWLADALRENHDVVLTGINRATPYPAGITLLQSLERTLYRRSGECAGDICNDDRISSKAIDEKIAIGQSDLVIDLSSGMSAGPQGARVIAPLYNGVADEVAAADALLNRELVDLAIYDSAHGSCIWRGRSAAEDRNVFSMSLDNVFCRAGSLLARAVDIPPVISADAKPYNDAVKQFAKSGSELSFLVTSVSVKAFTLLNKLCRGGHEWSIAWRKTHGDSIADQPAGTSLTFQRHSNNPGSYFADPFVFARDGRYYLFVEEFLNASNKGVISLITIGDDGKLGPSQVVLERPYHLSYPFVFERGGEIYMIPETGAARRVELYRAERFPDKWSLHSVLIDNIAAYDVTLCEHGDRLWLFMATGQWQSSSWDTLEIFHASKLEGSWTPMSHNPVLVDPSGTRPAGCVFQQSGVLWRPAQDSSVIYGGSLSLCRIDELSSDRFRQSTMSHLVPAPASAISGVHTLNCAQGFETVDLFGARSSEPAKLVLTGATAADRV